MVQGKAANRVLRKEPPSKGEIKKTDKLSVNDNFVSKLVKVKILSVISKQVFHECQFFFNFINSQTVGRDSGVPFSLCNFLEDILPPTSFKMTPTSNLGL